MHTGFGTAGQCMVPRPMADSLEVGIENVTEFEVEEGS
jgi:hypothetical protein